MKGGESSHKQRRSSLGRSVGNFWFEAIADWVHGNILSIESGPKSNYLGTRSSKQGPKHQCGNRKYGLRHLLVRTATERRMSIKSAVFLKSFSFANQAANSPATPSSSIFLRRRASSMSRPEMDPYLHPSTTLLRMNFPTGSRDRYVSH